MNNKDYQNINDNDLNIPHIYLTSEEIIEFNEECRKSGIDLKVVPFSDYMNIEIEDKDDDDDDIDNSSRIQLENSFKDNSNGGDENEEKKSFDEEKNIIINNINLNNHKDTKVNINQYINKKREIQYNKLDSEPGLDSDSDKENNKSIENHKDFDEEDKNKSSFSFSSSSFNINKSNIPLNFNKNKAKNKNKNKKNEFDEKSYKKKKINPKNIDINNNFSNFFRKIQETSDQNKNEKMRKKEIIQEILEMSVNLTEQGLREIADIKHIGLVGNEFNKFDLEGKTINQLETLLGDIRFNIKINRLDSGRNNTIKKVQNQKEMERNEYDK